VITTSETSALLGSGLAAVRWTDATHDDLAIGAPGADAGNGKIYVFRVGRRSAPARARSRPLMCRSAWPRRNPAGSRVGLGSVLAAADIDGDGTADLLARHRRNGSGGAAIVYAAP